MNVVPVPGVSQACYDNYLVGSEAYEECVKEAKEKLDRARGKGPVQ